jgi:hypothetical protein
MSPVEYRLNAVSFVRGHVAPGDAGPQYVHDARECGSIGDAPPPGTAVAPCGSQRQERSQTLPQVVRNKIGAHPDTAPT